MTSAAARPRRRHSERRSLAAVEKSLYATVGRIKERHKLERLGIAFYDSQTTLQWSYNADALFHAASTIKLAVLLALYGEVARGHVSADDPLHVRNRFTSLVDGKPFTVSTTAADAAVVKHLGRTMSLKGLATEMITRSSNLATNLLTEAVGVETIQRALDELRIDGIVMRRGVMDQAAYDAGVNNLASASGLLALMRRIAEGRAFSTAVCADMLEILLGQRSKSGIPAGLPADAMVAHKTGNISTVHHDAGIVYIGQRRPYFLVVLTQFPEAVRRSAAVAEITKGIHQSLAVLPREPVSDPGAPDSAETESESDNTF